MIRSIGHCFGATFTGGATSKAGAASTSTCLGTSITGSSSVSGGGGSFTGQPESMKLSIKTREVESTFGESFTANPYI